MRRKKTILSKVVFKSTKKLSKVIFKSTKDILFPGRKKLNAIRDHNMRRKR